MAELRRWENRKWKEEREQIRTINSNQTVFWNTKCLQNVFFFFRVLTESNSKILEYMVEKKSTAFVSWELIQSYENLNLCNCAFLGIFWVVHELTLFCMLTQGMFLFFQFSSPCLLPLTSSFPTASWNNFSAHAKHCTWLSMGFIEQQGRAVLCKTSLFMYKYWYSHTKYQHSIFHSESLFRLAMNHK